jgi:hypothetical protein
MRLVCGSVGTRNTRGQRRRTVVAEAASGDSARASERGRLDLKKRAWIGSRGDSQWRGHGRRLLGRAGRYSRGRGQ